MKISNISGLNRNTVNHYIQRIKEGIAEICELNSPFRGEIEVDESYFGARHQNGKRGRDAFGKTIVFGIYPKGMVKYIRDSTRCKSYNG